MVYPDRFIVTSDHIKLVHQMYFRWEDDAYDGAPAVDIKRPYGNSDVYGDVAEILGWWPQDGDELPEEVQERCKKIHEEMALVLQILVENVTEGLKSGFYVNTHQFAPYASQYKLEAVILGS